MTDPAWYTEALANHPEWAAHVAECVAWIPAGEVNDSEGAYIMQTALSAFVLHMHRIGGGVMHLEYGPPDGVMVVVGTPGDDAPRTMPEARARIVMLRHEVARLREQIPDASPPEVSGE